MFFQLFELEIKSWVRLQMDGRHSVCNKMTLPNDLFNLWSILILWIVSLVVRIYRDLLLLAQKWLIKLQKHVSLANESNFDQNFHIGNAYENLSPKSAVRSVSTRHSMPIWWDAWGDTFPYAFKGKISHCNLIRFI